MVMSVMSVTSVWVVAALLVNSKSRCSAQELALTMGTPILDATNLDGAYGVSTSPDGKHVYAVAFDGDSIVPFVRDESTGALTMGTPIQNATNLDDASGVATSPDGKHVYAVAYLSGSIVPLTVPRVPPTPTLAPDATVRNGVGLLAVAAVTVATVMLL